MERIERISLSPVRPISNSPTGRTVGKPSDDQAHRRPPRRPPQQDFVDIDHGQSADNDAALTEGESPTYQRYSLPPQPPRPAPAPVLGEASLSRGLRCYRQTVTPSKD